MPFAASPEATEWLSATLRLLHRYNLHTRPLSPCRHVQSRRLASKVAHCCGIKNVTIHLWLSYKSKKTENKGLLNYIFRIVMVYHQPTYIPIYRHFVFCHQQPESVFGTAGHPRNYLLVVYCLCSHSDSSYFVPLLYRPK